MAFSLKAYRGQTKPFTAKLGDDSELTGRFYTNFLTGNTIDDLEGMNPPRYEDIVIGSDEEGNARTAKMPIVTNQNHKDRIINELCFLLAGVDIEEKPSFGESAKNRDAAFKEKKLVLQQFDISDLQKIQSSVQDAMTGFLEKDGTSSSSGSQPTES